MTYYSTPTRPDEIWHHGIKGMHWGIRKYQNEDGSLTPAGERHYYKKDGSLKRRGKNFFLKQYKKKAYDNVHKQLDAKYGKDKWVNELHGKSLHDQNRLYGKAFDDVNAYKERLKNGYVPVQRKKDRVESELRKAMNQQVYWKRHGDAQKAQEAWDRRMELQKKLNNLR